MGRRRDHGDGPDHGPGAHDETGWLRSPIPLADVPDARRSHLLFPERVPVDTAALPVFSAPAWRMPAQGAGLAACCHAVYHDATTARSAYRELGWTLQQRIERAGVRADWLTRKDCRLLVCCGTRAREIGNLRYDADTILVHYALGGRVHRGFLRAFETLAANFDGRIGGGGLPWFAVGHSLGGALAILAAAHWQAAGVVAFGCPRVGDPDFVAAIAALPVLRYQNGCDLVGHLPPQRLGFAHVGLLRYRVPGDGIIDAPEAGRLRRSQRRAKLRYALGLPWFRPGAIWFRELADHAIHNYAKVLRCR